MHHIFAGSLPTSHPSFAPQKNLEMSSEWQAPSLPDGPVELFIGILSAGNHFAERMAVRKSWMRAVSKSSNMVARFFVALVNPQATMPFISHSFPFRSVLTYRLWSNSMEGRK